MIQNRLRTLLMVVCLAGIGLGLSTVEAAESRPVPGLTTIGFDGLITIIPPEVPERFRNPSTEEYEAFFRHRYNLLLRDWTRNADGSFGRVDQRRFFESEKWSYPHAMLHVLAGNVGPGMALLQAPDQPQNPRDNDHTLGIDLYPAFTLKGQVRKYFQFGHLMEDDYRQLMSRAIDIWTQSHPRHTPHPIYQRYNPNVQGWGPNRFGNRQVDGRRTDNLYAMTTVAVYLFAEASGNEATRQRAKDELMGYVWALYHIGHGEWDSTSYHSHVTAPYMNLYDFAQDPEVRMAAKVALDHFFTAAALKSHRLTFAGPSKRDYQPTSVQAGETMKFFWMYFPGPDEVMGREHDQLFGMASAYRPPPAVVALAERQIDLPVEILSTKPEYENWHAGRSDRPRNFETLWLGRTFTGGSVVSPGGDGDLLPFRIVFNRGETGTNALTINSRPRIPVKHAGDQVGQYENLFLWLRPKSNEPFALAFAEGGEWTVRNGRWFFDGGDTWFALTPINLEPPAAQELDRRTAQRFPNIAIGHARQGDGPFSGFALEVEERGGPHASFEAFVRAVERTNGLNLRGINRGEAAYRSTTGKTLMVRHNSENDLPVVIRNGKTRNWNDPAEWALWRTLRNGSPVSADQAVIDLGWKTGTLTVRAGGKQFQSRFEIPGEDPRSIRREDLERRREIPTEAGFSNR